MSSRPSPRYRSLGASLVACVLLFLGTFSANADRLIGVDNSQGLLFEIDRSTGQLSSFVELPFSACGPGGYIRALARHPGTGVYYVLAYDSDSWPILATADPTMGTVTPVTRIGIPKNPGGSPSITFGPGPNYPLYLINGGGNYSISSGAIYVVNLATGAATPTGWTTAGNGGHAIEYNPDDGFLYHFYKAPGNVTGLEKIHPSTGAATPVTLSGDPFDTANGVAYAGGGLFYTINYDSDIIYGVTSAGAVSEEGTVAEHFRNLAWDGSSLLGLDDADNFHRINPVTGAYSESIPIVSTPCFRRMESIAQNPVSGEYYALTYPDHPETEKPTSLVKINPVNGSLTGVVTLSVNNLSEIAFDGDGDLYGIAGPSLTPLLPGQLEGGTIVSIDMITGTVTPEAWATAKGGHRPHTLAFHPGNGLFYHVYWRVDDGMILMETVDPDSGAVTPVGTLLSHFDGPNALLYDPSLGEFFLQIEGNLYRVTTAGIATPVVQNIEFYSAGGLAIAPDLVDPKVAQRAKLLRQIRVVSRQLKIAKRKKQVARVKSLSRKLRNLRIVLRNL